MLIANLEITELKYSNTAKKLMMPPISYFVHLTVNAKYPIKMFWNIWQRILMAEEMMSMLLMDILKFKIVQIMINFSQTAMSRVKVTG